MTDRSLGAIDLDGGLERLLDRSRALDLTASAIAIADSSATLVFQNAAFARLNSTLRESGDGVADGSPLFPSDQTSALIRDCLLAARPGSLRRTFFYGRRMPVELTLVFRPVLDASTSSVYAVVITIGEESIEFDGRHLARRQETIREQVARIEQLTRSGETSSRLVRTLLRDTPFAVMLIDAKRRVLQMNRSCEEFLATSTREARGRTCDDYIVCFQCRECCPILDRDESIWRQETEVLGAGGARTPTLRSAVRLGDSDEPIILEAFVDISELKQKNRQLESYVYSASHDLRSPLVTVAGFLGLMDRSARAGRWQEFGKHQERVMAAVETMAGRLDALLRTARAGYLRLELEDVRLDEVVARAIELVMPSDVDPTVDVEIKTGPVLVRGDQERLLEVFQNLVDNAVRFMGDQERPRVEIGARAADAWVTCHVSDNGVGIDVRHQEEIFGLFSKLGANAGTGVGLALVKQIVESHGGRIWARSDGPGAGSSFHFTLPAAAKRG